jgi:ribosome production factor 1
VPRTLDNTREFDPSILTANPSAIDSSVAGPSSAPSNAHAQAELIADLDIDPFADYFSAAVDPSLPPKVLITTSAKATKATYALCEELVGLLPGGEFIKRKKGKGFEMGRIAGWAAGRNYSCLCVVNEDMKKPSMFASKSTLKLPPMLCLQTPSHWCISLQGRPHTSS